MEGNKIPAVIMAAVIAVILTASLLVPIINSGIDVKTVIDNTNSAYVQLNDIGLDDDYIITVSGDSPRDWNVNGTVVQTDALSTVIITDKFLINVHDKGAQTTDYGAILEYGTGTWTSLPIAYALSIVFDDGSIVISYGNGLSKTYEYTWAKAICPFGTGKYTNVSGTASVNSYDQITIGHNSYWGTDGNYTNMDGTEGELSGGVVSDRYDSLIEFTAENGLKFTVGDNTTSITNFIVPCEIDAYEYDVRFDTANSILFVIPILVIVGVLLMVIRAFMRTE